MRIRIVCYEEDVTAWILGKFAIKMEENLIKLGYSVEIARLPDKTADINHHIIYLGFNGGEKQSINTLMITHIDNTEKLELIKKQMQIATLGICMSSETMYWLIQMGVDKKKLCYVNPAHDSLVTIKKYIIGITCRVHFDGRKRETFIDNLAKELDPKYFSFKIMGDSWDSQVDNLRKNGFEVEFYDSFIKEKYYDIINSLDYYLYTGMDEGQMGFLDAAAAGVFTIVTSQGYHLDAINGITHPFKTYDELRDIFLKIQNERAKLVDSVSTWNWLDYTKKHVELWEHIMGDKKIKSVYKDGLNSLNMMSESEIQPDTEFINKKKRELQKVSRKHRINNFKYSIRLKLNRFRTKGLLWSIVAVSKKIFKY